METERTVGYENDPVRWVKIKRSRKKAKETCKLTENN